jgi:hypothetical protein
MKSITELLRSSNLPEYRPNDLFVFIIINFFLSFISAFGGIWLILEPFDFGSKFLNFLYGKDIGKWFFLLITSLFVSAIFVFIRLFLYYYNQYRIYRESSIVDKLYPNRNWLEDHYSELIKKAEKEIFMIGISGSSITNLAQRSIESKISSNENDCNVRLLICHQESDFVKLREIDEEKPIGRISGDCKKNHEVWKKMENSHITGKFQILQIKNAIITGYYLKIDDTLYFEPYLTFNPGRHCPLFVITRNDNTEKVFGEFHKQMNDLWDKAIRETK